MEINQDKQTLNSKPKESARRLTIGKTTYIITSNFVPNKQNKEALIKAIHHVMKNRVKPEK